MNRPAFKIDTENPGSEIAGEAAAALAAARFSSEQTIQPTRRTFSPMRRRFSTLPTPTAAATSMLSPALGGIIIRLDITTSWSGARSGFIRRPAKAITYKRQNRSTANISRRLRCAGPIHGTTSAMGQLSFSPNRQSASPTCGGWALVELLDNWRSRRANRIHARWLGVAGLTGLIALCRQDRFSRLHPRRYG